VGIQYIKGETKLVN